MTGSFLLKFKNKQWLFCVLLSVIISILMIETNINIKDKRMIDQPLSKNQFLYSLLKEDYESGKAVDYEYINKKGGAYSAHSLELLYEVLLCMNKHYSYDENVYDIDFSTIDEEALQKKVLAFAKSSKQGSFFLASSLNHAYALYTNHSPYFRRNRVEGKRLASIMINYIKLCALNGYEKKIGPFVYKVYCSQKESDILLGIAEKLELRIDEEDEKSLEIECEKAYSELDTLLGQNTNFQQGWMSFEEPGTVEEATALFLKMESNNEITDSYVRLFSDYMGILAGTLPIIISAFCLSTGSKRRNEIIYSKRFISRKVVLCEFFGTLCVYGLIFLCFYILESVKYVCFTDRAEWLSYCLTFLKYYLFLIIPTMTLACVLPMALYEVINNGVVSVVISITVMFFSLSDFSKQYPIFSPILRFNEFGNVDEYLKLLPRIVINRISVVAASVLLLILTMKLFEYRRTHIK